MKPLTLMLLVLCCCTAQVQEVGDQTGGGAGPEWTCQGRAPHDAMQTCRDNCDCRPGLSCQPCVATAAHSCDHWCASTDPWCNYGVVTCPLGVGQACASVMLCQ